MPRKKLSEQEKIQICEKYLKGGVTCAEISREYNRTVGCIWLLLKKRNIPIFNDQSVLQRKYTLNEHYFDEIDCEEKAYFLGYLYADGWNSPEKSTVGISLQETDKHILETFKILVDSNNELKFVDKNNKNPKWQNMYTLYMNSKYLCNRLTELGCWSSKSLTLEFPTENQVPSHLIRHFIRGYFDGDGHIALNYNKNKTMNIVASLISTENFCNKLCNLLNTLDLNCSIYKPHKDKDTVTRVLDLRTKINSLKFLDWIYENSTIFLIRKYNQLQEYKRTLEPEYIQQITDPNIMPNCANFTNLLQEPEYKCGKLTVKKYVCVRIEGVNKKRRIHYWLCKCECGNAIEVRSDNLLRKTVKSCGCLRHRPSGVLYTETNN